MGTGFWAQYGHIPALRSVKGFDVVAISSRRKESAEQSAEKFDIPRAFGDPYKLINDPDVDLVAVVTPAPEHAPPGQSRDRGREGCLQRVAPHDPDRRLGGAPVPG
jgi:predicted dehydrogenase